MSSSNIVGQLFSPTAHTDGFLGFVDTLRVGFGRIEAILALFAIVISFVSIICTQLSMHQHKEAFSYQALHKSRIESNIAKGMIKNKDDELHLHIM